VLEIRTLYRFFVVFLKIASREPSAIIMYMPVSIRFFNAYALLLKKK